jgi:PAS domain S-box-containing protein
MKSKDSETNTLLPRYLTGTLLVRGRTRVILTVVFVGIFAIAGEPFLDPVGYDSNALLAPVSFSIAWMWGRTIGVTAAAAGSLANIYWANQAGVTVSTWSDAVAIMSFAFLIGHIAGVLEGAVGARARTDQAFQELEYSARDRMLTITDQVPVGLYRTTPDGTIIGGNDALMSILGFVDRAAMLQANVWDHYVRSEDRQAHLVEGTAAEGEWREFELRRADGSTVLVRDWSRSVRGSNGDVVHFDGVLEDVSEQHVANERFRVAFEESPTGMTISTMDGTVIRGNAVFAEMMGIPLDEVAGTHYSEYTDEDDLEATAAALDRVKAGEVVRYEKQLRRSDGSTFWALISLAPLGYSTLESDLFISHTTDITERRMAQQALEELIRSKDELIASVSHELRTPLTVVHGLAQELDSKWASFSVPEQKEFIGLIAQQSAEVAHIVEDLLVAARAEIGKLPIVAENVDLMVQLESASTSVAGLEVTVERVGDATPVAFADPMRVRQILRNLLSNAERYGGRDISAHLGVGDDCVWFELADSGDGIPGDDVTKAFDPYHRAHNAEGQPRSVGLGLTVSRRLATLMGGTLTYRYEAERAIFRLELPSFGKVHGAPAISNQNR